MHDQSCSLTGAAFLCRDLRTTRQEMKKAAAIPFSTKGEANKTSLRQLTVATISRKPDSNDAP